MADEDGVVAGGVEAAVDGVMQGSRRQRAPALEHEVLVHDEVAFVRGLKSRRPGPGLAPTR